MSVIKIESMTQVSKMAKLRMQPLRLWIQAVNHPQPNATAAPTACSKRTKRIRITYSIRFLKHNTKGIRRRWRKLHLGLDLASGAIVCAALTHDNVGDSTALPGLLDQLDAPVTGFLADGAYDRASTRNLLRQRYGETLDVVIPPPKDAVIRLQSARDATVRDRHIAQIRSNGCMAWQTATGYNQRSRIETQMGRWKSVIGPKLKFRSFSRQITALPDGLCPECGSGFAQDRKGRRFRRHLEKLPKRDKNGNVLCDENGKVVMCGGTLLSWNKGCRD